MTEIIKTDGTRQPVQPANGSDFTLEEMQREGSHPRCEVTDELLSMLDVLVDGRFVEELKDISLRFRGSSNQRLIDMKKTLAAGKIVLLPDLDRKSGRQAQT